MMIGTGEPTKYSQNRKNIFISAGKHQGNPPDDGEVRREKERPNSQEEG